MLDLTSDTVTAENLIEGATAHNAAGERITGAAKIPTKTSELENDSGFITASAIPSSLPANGGNADTVGGKSAESIFDHKINTCSTTTLNPNTPGNWTIGTTDFPITNGWVNIVQLGTNHFVTQIAFGVTVRHWRYGGQDQA